MIAISLLFLVLVGTHPAACQTWKELLEKADSLAKVKNLDSALIVGRLSLKLAQNHLADSDTTSARIMGFLAVQNYRKGNMSEAESCWTQSNTIWMDFLGEANPQVAKNLRNLGVLYTKQSRFMDAESTFQASIRILEGMRGAENAELAEALWNLGALYRSQARLDDAENCYLKSNDILKSTLNADMTALAKVANSLGILYREIGDFNQSEKYYKSALSIREKNLTPSDPDIAATVNNLGNLYWEQGRFVQCEEYYRRALAIREKAFPESHPLIAASMNNFAALYMEQWMYEKAEPLLRRALDIRIKTYGLKHDDVAEAHHNLGVDLFYQGKHDEADSLFRVALAIEEELHGKDDPMIAFTLNSIADLYRIQGRYSEGVTLSRRAVNIAERKYGNDHPRTSEFQLTLGKLYMLEEKYDLALALLDSSSATLQATLGSESSKIAKNLLIRSELYRRTRNDDPTLPAKGAFAIRQRNFLDNFGILPEKDALESERSTRAALDNYLSCFLDNTVRKGTNEVEVADALLMFKGQVFDMSPDRHQSEIHPEDSLLSRLIKNLRTNKFRLSRHFIEGPGEDVSQFRREGDSLAAEVDKLKTDLARYSVRFRSRETIMAVTSHGISFLLPEKSNLLEFFKWDYQQLKPETTIAHYLAVVIPAGKSPQVTDLGGAKPIDDAISDYRHQIELIANSHRLPAEADTREYEKTARRLYDLVLKPIEGSLNDAKELFIAPDGGLNLVSFAGLIAEDGKYLIEKYPIHYLSAGRDLIRLQEQSTANSGLFALGDPDYDASVSQRMSAPETRPQSMPAARPSLMMYNQRSVCDELHELKVEPLPSTRLEVTDIVNSWKSATGQQPVYYVGRFASEDRFKSEVSGKQVIHLATHGFFLGGECQPKHQSRSFLDETSFMGENPLLLSGLLLAGANLHGEGADSLGVDDGILTAEEVSGLNLEGMKLVVLSACETGLGKVEQGEGVYGLRRAFQMAGARTVVSALWKVDDKTTAEMMKELYRQSDEPIPVRMRNMQLAQIKKLRDEGLSDHPFWWGAFIAMGDWR